MAPIAGILSLPPEVLLQIFKSFKCRRPTRALALAHPTLFKIYKDNTNTIFLNLAQKIFGNAALDLAKLSKEDALHPATRIYIDENTKREAGGFKLETFFFYDFPDPLFCLMTELHEVLDKDSTNFWTANMFLEARKNGLKGVEMDEKGFDRFRKYIQRKLWKGYTTLFRSQALSFNGPRSPEHGTNELQLWRKGIHKQDCRLCLQMHTDKETDPGCGCQGSGCLEGFWFQQFKVETDHHLDSLLEGHKFADTVITFDAYLRILYLAVRCLTPFPNTRKELDENWKCTSPDNCRICEKYLPPGGFHFINYSLTETLSGADWLAILEIGFRFRESFFQSFTSYWEDLIIFSNRELGLRTLITKMETLPDLKNLKKQYFDDANFSKRKFDLKVIETGPGKKEVMVVDREKWESISSKRRRASGETNMMGHTSIMPSKYL